jgi:transposase-like protein
MKKILAASVVGGLLLGGTGMAWAATGGGSDPTPSTSAAPGTDPKPAAGRAALARGALKVAADTIHVDQKDLVAELRAGKTIADVANEHHVAPQTVIDAIVNAAKARIATAVQNGKLTQDRADKLEARLPQLADKLVNGHVHPRRLARRQATRGALEVAADTLHVDQKDLVTELRSGKSIADVANEHHVAPQTVIDAIVNAAKARIATAVQNGKLTQDRADKLEARLPQLADKLVNGHVHPRAGQSGNTSNGPNAAPASLAA